MKLGTKLKWVAATLTLALYAYIAFFTNREQFSTLIIPVSVLFLIYSFLFKQKFQLKELLLIGIIFRTIFMFNEPQLSDDYLRFYWDGLSSLSGLNPYGQLPSEIIELNPSVFLKLNSPEYYSVYPPFLQYIFAFASKLGNSAFGFTIVCRSIILLVEVLLFFTLNSMLGANIKSLSLYFLNPLIIIEGIGNLHFEILMIAFCVSALYFLLNKMNIVSGAFITISILIKLYPILFVAYFFGALKGIKTKIIWSITMLVILVLLSMQFINLTSLENIFSSVKLYAQNFEFNASIYYLARAIGSKYLGYNPIQTIGPILSYVPLIVALLLGLLSLVKNKTAYIPFYILATLSVFYLFATTVMPWYIIGIVVISIFTPFKFPIIWSALIFFSYQGYSVPGYKENLWLVLMEYALLYSYIIYEYVQHKKYIKQALNWA